MLYNNNNNNNTSMCISSYFIYYEIVLQVNVRSSRESYCIMCTYLLFTVQRDKHIYTLCVPNLNGNYIEKHLLLKSLYINFGETIQLLSIIQGRPPKNFVINSVFF